MENKEQVYNKFLKNALFKYYSEQIFISHYNRVPKQRDETFSYCVNYLNNRSDIKIVELGTSRSFVDGNFDGVCINDLKFWEPNSLDKWDWSAGLFTKYFSDVLTERGIKFSMTTVDINKEALSICETITNDHKKCINYINSSSEKFIEKCPKKSIDLLYLDTGNMDEKTALLHLREAKLLVKNQIIKDDGLILIDDVRNPSMLVRNVEKNKFGKSKYSIPYFLQNGYEIIMDEYQVILKK
jgi:hypothetical protein